MEVSTGACAFPVGGTVTDPNADVALASNPAAASDTERMRFALFSTIGMSMDFTSSSITMVFEQV